MAGRHLRTVAEVNTLAKNGAKGLAAASLLGVIAGVTAPIANAATANGVAVKDSGVANAALGSEVQTEAAALPVQAKVEILNVNSTSGTSAWSLSDIEIEAEEAPEPVVVETPAEETQTVVENEAATSGAAATEATQAESSTASETEAAVPASSGANAVVAAALAQLGEAQDCTRLVWDSLVAAGYASGPKTVGTGIWQYDRFGSRVSLSALQPGDILVYGNAASGAHVAIYIGGGQAVHGGWNGYTTVIGPVQVNKPLTGAVRPGA